MKIAVTGATGHLGRLVVDNLKTKVSSDDIVGLVRNPAKASELGVTVRAADYSQRETLDEALQGIDVLLFISGSEAGQRIPQHQNVINAAKEAGVKRIVYTSLLRADTSPLSLAAEHLFTENAIKATGIPFTILRNGWYTENYAGSVRDALLYGAFVGSAGDGKISSAARADYAEAATVVVTTEGREGKTYELAGDEAYTLAELAAEISRQMGQTILYKDLPVADYAAVLVSVGLPEALAQAIAGYDLGASQGALFDDGRQLSGLIGRPTTGLAVVVADAFKRMALE